VSFEEAEIIRKRAEAFDPRILELVNDVKKLHYIARLEEAYIASRYLPITYEESEAKDLLKFVLEVFNPLVQTI